MNIKTNFAFKPAQLLKIIKKEIHLLLKVKNNTRP